jgi:hypothetical protein
MDGTHSRNCFMYVKDSARWPTPFGIGLWLWGGHDGVNIISRCWSAGLTGFMNVE